MNEIWGATQFALIVYGLGAVVSFLVAWVITLTFGIIRMHSRRKASATESQGKAEPSAKDKPSVKAEPEKGA